jgi:hypothetical protein
VKLWFSFEASEMACEITDAMDYRSESRMALVTDIRLNELFENHPGDSQKLLVLNQL